MISVIPVEDRDRIAELFQQNGIAFCEISSAVEASDGHESLGYCLFDLSQKGILVHTLEPREDAFLADGILRSALHVAAERSAMDARYATTAPEQLLKNLGFVQEGKEGVLDIDLLFRGCCCEK